MIPAPLAGDLMKRFVEGQDRAQSTLFPECLENWIGEDNPVRAIDVFVEELDLADVGFAGVDPKATGRPSYHPSVVLKVPHRPKGRNLCGVANPQPNHRAAEIVLRRGMLVEMGLCARPVAEATGLAQCAPFLTRLARLDGEGNYSTHEASVVANLSPRWRTLRGGHRRGPSPD